MRLSVGAVAGAICRAHDSRNCGAVTLGGLLHVLEMLPDSTPVQFDDGTYPQCVGSWRGSYDEPAIEPGDAYTDAARLRRHVADAAGGQAEYAGYKGGTYTFAPHSPINIDRHGDASDVCLAGMFLRVDQDGAKLVLCRGAGE